jgi:hypothetical protein
LVGNMLRENLRHAEGICCIKEASKPMRIFDLEGGAMRPGKRAG